jgi:hypothetical protein
VKKNAKLSDLQVATRITLLITIIKLVQFSFGERMEPLLNCPENKEYNLSGSYIERTPQAESIRTRRFESQIRSRRRSKRMARGARGQMEYQIPGALKKLQEIPASYLMLTH